MDQFVDQLGNAPRQPGPRVGDAEAHGVAEPDLGLEMLGDLIGHLGELLHEGEHKTLDVGPREVLQVAAGPYLGFERRLHDLHILIEGPGPVGFHLVVNVVIRRGGEHARFLQAHFPHQPEVALTGPDPSGDLRVLEPQLPALVHGLAILWTVEEKFRLADHAVGPSQPGHEPVECDDLVHGVRGSRLLAVTERGVRDHDVAIPDLGGIISYFFSIDHLDDRTVKGDLGHLIVVEDVL